VTRGTPWALVAWWAGLAMGPLSGVMVMLLAEPDDVLARAHGRAATIFWAASYLLWIPLGVWLVLSGDSFVLLMVGSLVNFAVAIAVCVVGSLQAASGRSLAGRPLH
jgi:hypothetical protein